MRTVGSQAYAILLSGQPLTIPVPLVGVSFAEMRSGDLDGTLSWLWHDVDAPTPVGTTTPVDTTPPVARRHCGIGGASGLIVGMGMLVAWRRRH